MPLHAWSSARYSIPLPDGHRFPIAKYAMLRDLVLAERLVSPDNLHEPARASRRDLLLAHTPSYVDRLTSGTLSAPEMRRIGFPWSEQLVERSYRAVGGTCEAARAALVHGVAINLAAGNARRRARRRHWRRGVSRRAVQGPATGARCRRARPRGVSRRCRSARG